MLTINRPNMRRQRSCCVDSAETESVDSLDHRVVVLLNPRREIKVRSAFSTWILKTIYINVTVWLWIMSWLIRICIWMMIAAGRLNVGHGRHAAGPLPWIARHFMSAQKIETRRVITRRYYITTGRIRKCSGTLISIRARLGSHFFLLLVIFVSPFSFTFFSQQQNMRFASFSSPF